MYNPVTNDYKTFTCFAKNPQHAFTKAEKNNNGWLAQHTV